MENEEKLKIGYQGAVQIATMEAQIIWTAFQSLIAANAFLLTLGGVVIKVFPQVAWASIALGIGGVVICLAWLAVSARQFSYFGYWISWARSIEQQTLSPATQMFRLGRTYGEGATVDLPEVGGMQMRWAGKVFKVQQLIAFIIFIFIFMYFLLIWLSITTPE